MSDILTRNKIDPIDGNSWRQSLFDLMCNETVRLEIRGEIGEVDAEIWFCQVTKNDTEVAQIIGAEDFESAMCELMDKVGAYRRAHPKVRATA